MPRVLLGAVAVSLALRGGVALAESPEDEAERLLRHGVELRKAQDDEQALKEFQKAYQLSPTPRAEAQVGLAEQAVGRWDDAHAHVTDALRSRTDPWIAKNEPALAEALAYITSHIGRIEVMGEPPGAEVLVNGRLKGRLPIPDPITVSIGLVDVEVRANGYASASRTIAMTAGQYQHVVIRLTRPPPDANDRLTVVPTAPASTSASPTRSAMKWASLGLAGLSLATAGVATILRERNVGEIKDGGCFDRGGRAVDVKGTPAPQCQGPLDASFTERTLQVIGLASAGAFGATWLILGLVEPTGASTERQASTRLMCAPSILNSGIACARRF